MKTNAKDYVSIAQQFFTAYDAHDVDGMLALCADGALGRYAPYGRESVVPIRGGIDVIWRAFPNAVPNFRVKVIEMIPAEGNTVVIQAEMGWWGRAPWCKPSHIRRSLRSSLQPGRPCHLAASWQIQWRSGSYSSCRKFSLGESTR